MYSDSDNMRRINQVQDPNFRQQLMLEEKRRQMIEREKLLLDREHSQRMN